MIAGRSFLGKQFILVREWLKIVVLFMLLGFAAYANVLSYPFVHDDIAFIKENPNIHKIDDFSSFIKPVFSFRNDFSIANFYYRPLLELYYRVEYQLFRFNVWGYHLTNILIHIANSILIFILLSKFMRQISPKIHNKGIFAIVPLLFLIHPVQSESVACISGVSNLMYTFLERC